ncbi:MAG TPA: UDP-N-acetylmuramoyl-L-alanine--D-glutamate ligase [Burkholderiaceae bacterium]|nr:UDP-N-acetylmuramoyl-L-alanine--D-glutamate ligase [Burkholderiaceae bacterium]
MPHTPYSIRQRPVLVLGHGISGQAMARWCVRLGARVTVADTRQQPELMARLQSELSALALQVAGQCGEDSPDPHVVAMAFGPELLASQPWALVCKSPGLSPAQLEAVTEWAQSQGVPVVGELDLFADGLRRVYAHAGFVPKVLAITGTNGKTTTTSLTGQLLVRAGWRVAVAGNIGPALLDVLTVAAEKEQNGPPSLIQQADDAIPELTIEAPSDAPGGRTADPFVQGPFEPDTVGPHPVEAGGGEPGAVADPGTLNDTEVDTDRSTSATPASDVSTLPQVWVLELSSFQLDEVRTGPGGFEPTAATVLNITQDHLDWHGSMAHYTAAKNRVYGQAGVRVLNRDDAAVMAARPEETAPLTRGKARQSAGGAGTAGAATVPWVSFGTDVPQRPGDWGLETVNGMTWLVRAQPADETRLKRKAAAAVDEQVLQRLMPAEALRIRGRHNAANALAALALATAAGAPLAPMLHGLREYTGEPHRVATVAIINGVEFIDDSKGTNVGATLAAIKGLGGDRKLVMIMGGDGKGQDFSPLADAVRDHVRAVVLIGRDAPALRRALSNTGVLLIDAPDLTTAVQAAAEQAYEGDVVVMSPACASLDMFRNYAHRAEVFCAAVDELATEVGMLGGQA